MTTSMQRRRFLALSARSGQYLLAGAFLSGCYGAAAPHRPDSAVAPRAARSGPAVRDAGGPDLGGVGPLGAPDENGVRLPPGFRSRIVAVTGQPPLGAGGHMWHAAPDGGAVFAVEDGGWIYVSNSEVAGGRGGAGALRFDASGQLVGAYPILAGTSRNCAGGATPWQTWLSCEEVATGLVWECDPRGKQPAVPRPALGRFNHEAVAVDPATGQLYLTEDEHDGRWYRFTPREVAADGRADLDAGLLEVARVEGGHVSWVPVPDPSAQSVSTRRQVRDSTPFDGGEGTICHDGFVYFATKGDNRVWAYDIAGARLSIVYDAAAFAAPVLTGVDNIAVGPAGEIIVAEDRGDMQLVTLTSTGAVTPLLQVVGHPISEITGPAFSPDHRRLYFSSQRGNSWVRAIGITYEISGPFQRAT
jgi:uncharacterized protein